VSKYQLKEAVFSRDLLRICDPRKDVDEKCFSSLIVLVAFSLPFAIWIVERRKIAEFVGLATNSFGFIIRLICDTDNRPVYCPDNRTPKVRAQSRIPRNHWIFWPASILLYGPANGPQSFAFSINPKNEFMGFIENQKDFLKNKQFRKGKGK
jgi:hypothetical protein